MLDLRLYLVVFMSWIKNN